MPGSFSKRLTYSSLTSNLREDVEMCDSIRTVDYEIKDDNFLKLLQGRYYYTERGDMKLLNYETDKDLIGKVVRFRSPITCNSKNGVCKYCYGHMFSSNMSLNSPGAFAALKLTEPIGQSILSSKHNQDSHSNRIEFSEGYDDIFETSNSMITMKEESDLDANLYLKLNRVFVDEMDDSETYYVEDFDVIDEQGNLLYHIEEMNGAHLYLNEELMKAYKQKMKNKHNEPVFSLEEFDDVEGLFTIEVKNKELTEALAIFSKVLNSKDHFGAKTISELAQVFAEKLMLLGIKYELVHAEMVLRPLIRKKSDITQTPDYGADANPYDWQLVKLDDAQFHHPSVLVGLPHGYLRRALISPDTYKKTAPGPLDHLYLSNLTDFDI